jgi:maltoporin
LEESPYLELDLYYTGIIDPAHRSSWRVVVASAFTDIFNYSGNPVSKVGLRNAYVETENLGLDGLVLWAGARMYRGDDIYLFDWWPLDNLNTVGAGASYQAGNTVVALHTGLNRLDSDFQFQQIEVASQGTAPTMPTVLDRPRSVSSVKITQLFPGLLGQTGGAKLSLYGELHELPSGTQVDPSTLMTSELPSDSGWVLGAQAGAWLRPATFINLWFRAAGGLAAYGDLTTPPDVDPTRKVSGARELVGALSANYETSVAGIMVGGYVRRFNDPGPGPFNPASYAEAIISTRPTIYWTEHLHTSVELSYQQRQSDGLDFATSRQLAPKVFRFSLMPNIAPAGKGSYSRPILYAVYTLSVLNQDAQQTLFAPEDVRYGKGVVHYLGVGAEWWFNSSYR